MLPPQLKYRVRRLAKKLGISLGELIRESLREMSTRTRAADEDPLDGDTVSYGGPAPAELAAHHDDYLYGNES